MKRAGIIASLCRTCATKSPNNCFRRMLSPILRSPSCLVFLFEYSYPFSCCSSTQPNQIAKHNQAPFALGVAYDPSGTKVAVSHSDGHIALYDVQAQKHILTYAGHSKPVKGLSSPA